MRYLPYKRRSVEFSAANCKRIDGIYDPTMRLSVFGTVEMFSSLLDCWFSDGGRMGREDRVIMGVK